MNKLFTTLIVLVSLLLAISCDIFTPKEFQMYNTSWSITNVSVNGVTDEEAPHKKLNYTETNYSFENEAGAVIETGPISNEHYNRYEYVMESISIEGFSDLQGESRYAEYTILNNTLTIMFYDSPAKNEKYLTMTAEKL